MLSATPADLSAKMTDATVLPLLKLLEAYSKVAAAK